MRKYSWLILCLALAVLLASAFAFTRADNQTEPAFGYTLDFKKPLSGIDNLSSLSYVPEEDVFVATLNRPATILKLSKNGEILARKSIADRIKDAESIEYAGNGTYLLVDEADSAMYVYQLSQDLDVRSVRKIETDLFENARNRGIEGIAWMAGRNELYFAKERKPVMLYRTQSDGGLTHFSEIVPLDDLIKNLDVDDISALHIHGEHLLILSDESRSLTEIDLNGNVLRRMSLTQGENGLEEDIPQPEGVSMDKAGNIYIMSEPNLFYRFEKVSTGR